jgi:hypothetical protein
VESEVVTSKNSLDSQEESAISEIDPEATSTPASSSVAPLRYTQHANPNFELPLTHKVLHEGRAVADAFNPEPPECSPPSWRTEAVRDARFGPIP